MDRLLQQRQAYARLVAANAGVPASQQKLIDAFATVPREHFLGPPPWRVYTRDGYIETPTDPALLYQDALVALKPEAHLNNGQPSLHMACLFHLNVSDGEFVVHVGAGTGYYTAILSLLAGPTGRVIGYEIDDDLAARATEYLSAYRNVEVRHESGTAGPLPECDVIYVSAGATAPLKAWTMALRPGGRLMFPLTTSEGSGAMLLVTRGAGGEFGARFISAVSFTSCIGARDDETSRRLAATFSKRDVDAVRSLRYGSVTDDSCWFEGPDWWLSTRP